MGRWHFRDRRRVFRERPVRSGLRRQGLNPPFETDPGPGASQSDSYSRQLQPMAALPRRPRATRSGSPESSQDAPASRSDGSTAFPATRALPRSGCPLTASDAGPTACRDPGYAAVQQVPERSGREPPFDSFLAHPMPTRRPPGLGIRDESHASRSAGRGAIAPAIRTVRYGTRTKSEPPPVGSGAARLRAGTPIH